MAANGERYWLDGIAGDNNNCIDRYARGIKMRPKSCYKVSLSNLLFRQQLEDLLKHS